MLDLLKFRDQYLFDHAHVCTWTDLVLLTSS